MELKELLKSGRTLLLGEGDFSFTRCVTDDVCNPNLVSSSYLSEDSISVHTSATDNIKSIRERGATVLFNIDATKIHQIEPLSSQLWDCVVFNFPHVGGKSNIKKNRRLLREFFTSVSKVLSPQGKVIVTLCKGQGGTVHDKPMRAWHDSWQVVAMAAFGGLILNEVKPFMSKDYPGYVCSGYRSRDQGFLTQAAVTHIFIKSNQLSPEAVITNLDPHQVQIDSEDCWCPSYVARRICRQLHNLTKHHPIQIICERIEQNLKSSWRTAVCDSQSFPIYKKDSTVKNASNGRKLDLSTKSVDTQLVNKEIKCRNGDDEKIVNKREAKLGIGVYKDPTKVTIGMDKTINLALTTINGNENSSNTLTIGCDSVKTHDKNYFVLEPVQPNFKNEISSHSFVLRQSLLCHTKELICAVSDHKVAVLAGQVYEKCRIGSSQLPVHHEMLIIWSPEESVKLAGENRTSDILDSLNNVTKQLLDIEITEPKEVELNQSLPCFRILDSQSLRVVQWYSVITSEKESIGNFFLVENEKNSQCNLILLLDLDKLASIVFKIDDVRLLWSSDSKFIEQFRNDNHDVINFKPFSLCFRSLEYDLTFWPSAAFTDGRMHNLIRDIADDYVTNLTFIESETDESGKDSLRYRMVLSSCDKALSSDDSYEFYQIIRDAMQREMKVVFRRFKNLLRLSNPKRIKLDDNL